MISYEREGGAVVFEGGTSDFVQFMKQVEKAADPDQKQQVVFRVLEVATGRHLNLIFRPGKSRDSL